MTQPKQLLTSEPRDCIHCGKPLEVPRSPNRQLHEACYAARAAERERNKTRTVTGVQRATTLALRQLRQEPTCDPGEDLERRPVTRAGCVDVPRPCPFVSCRHHLYLDVNEETGSIKLNWPDKEPDELEETCSLDVADGGHVTLDEVGELLNIVRERVRQIEVRALIKLKTEGL